MKNTIKKTIILVLTFIFAYYSPLQAQEGDRAYDVIPSCEKGLVSHVSTILTPKGAATEATNVRVNEEYGSLASRDVLVSEIDMGTGPINGLHRFYTSAGNAYTVAALGTYLKYDASGTATILTQGLTDGKRFQFVTYKDMMICGNGYDQPVKWDGYILTTANTDNARTADDLCAQLGAPFAQLSGENGGNDLDAESWYQYRICYYDGTTYRYCTARSNPIKTGTAASSTQNITLTDIPIGPAGTTHRYIYRTLGNASRAAVIADTTFYMVYDMADNTTTTYNDSMTDDDAEADNAPTWATVSGADDSNVTPPLGSLLEICNERLFISGNTTAGYQSDVYWSVNGIPDIFYPTRYVQVRPDDGDKVTFIKLFLGILTVGKTNSISKFYTEGDEIDSSGNVNWYVSNPFSFIGCPAPHSAAVTPKGIYYLSRLGLYTFTGQSSSLISDSITKDIKDISITNIAECVGYYWNNEYQLAYTSESAGGSINNRVLVYDLIRNAYVIDTKNVNCFAAFGSGSDYGTLYSGSATTDGYIFAHSLTTYTLSKKYKSEFDSGTYSNISSSGTESNPIISMVTIDKMNDYSTNTLARASWVSSETTASKKVPPDLGSGIDGSKTVSADETLTESVYNYTDLTVDAGTTLIIPSGTTLKVLGTVTVNGSIYCGGTLNIYAHTITVGAAGYIIGGLTLRANTINNSGIISGDACLASTISGSAPVAMIDNDFATIAQSGNGAITTAIFPDITNISTAKYRTSGSAYGDQDTAGAIVKFDGVYVYQTNINNSSFDTGTATNSTGWTNVNSMSMQQVTYGTGVSYGYEMQAIISTPVLDYLNGAVGTIRPTPAAADTTDYVYALDVFSEDTQKNEGDYSLKIVVPPGADTLNENVTKTISATDLSGYTYILLDVYALRDGTTMQLGLGEGALTDFVDIPVSNSNTWETVSIDISGIADANINATTKAGIKFTDTDSGNVVYIDNIRPAATSGTWTSEIYTINAEALKKLYWNENLNTYGDITWAVRTNSLNLMNGAIDQAATADAGASVVFRTTVAHGLAIGDWVTIAGTTDYNGDEQVTEVSDSTHFKITDTFVSDQSGTWTKMWTSTEYTNPNGSDISGETANTYIQLRASFSTTDTTNYLYPWLFQTDGYVVKLNYSKIGSNYESSVSNVWTTGWDSLGRDGTRKLIKRVIVDYEGEDESLTLNIKGDDYDVERSFSIDMSVLPDDDPYDRYIGTPTRKRYIWDSPVNTSTDQSLESELFQFTISHSGVEPFKVTRIKCIVKDENYY